MKLAEYKRKALEDPDFRKEYERFDLVFEIGMLWLRFKLFFYWTFDKLNFLSLFHDEDKET